MKRLNGLLGAAAIAIMAFAGSSPASAQGNCTIQRTPHSTVKVCTGSAYQGPQYWEKGPERVTHYYYENSRHDDDRGEKDDDDDDHHWHGRGKGHGHHKKNCARKVEHHYHHVSQPVQRDGIRFNLGDEIDVDVNLGWAEPRVVRRETYVVVPWLERF